MENIKRDMCFVRLFISIIVTIFFSGCIDTYVREDISYQRHKHKKKKTDELDNWQRYIVREFDETERIDKIYFMESDELLLEVKNANRLNNRFWLNPQIEMQEGTIPVLYLVFSHSGHDLLHIHKDIFSLMISADTLFFKYRCWKTNHDEETFHYQNFQKYNLTIEQEKAYYRLSPADFNKLFMSENVECTVKGNVRSINARVPEKVKLYWKKFYEANFIP